MYDVTDLTRVAPVLDCRAATFENPTGARGAGGTVANGRKGAPYRQLAAGENVTLADLEGPGTVRHIWMTFPPAPPEVMRAMVLEVFYDDLDDPSISVPCVDFFGSPHGRPVPLTTALTAIQEGRGFNSFIPMAFGRRIRIEFTNASDRPIHLYYQVDFTLGDGADDAGRLHASFRRSNPTSIKDDFVIEAGLRGPGRFLGCVVGIRTIDAGAWYGEGEVKVYRDGDTDLPTICGTGLEDYVGTAWGMGAHQALYAGVALDLRPKPEVQIPDFVGFYRWHVLDPIMFERELRVTIQQIGYDVFLAGDEARLARFEGDGMVAGNGLHRPDSGPMNGMVLAHGIVERQDDFCAVAYTVCRDPQPVPRLDVAAALADIGRLDYETANPMEATLMAMTL